MLSSGVARNPAGYPSCYEYRRRLRRCGGDAFHCCSTTPCLDNRILKVGRVLPGGAPQTSRGTPKRISEQCDKYGRDRRDSSVMLIQKITYGDESGENRINHLISGIIFIIGLVAAKIVAKVTHLRE